MVQEDPIILWPVLWDCGMCWELFVTTTDPKVAFP